MNIKIHHSNQFFTRNVTRIGGAAVDDELKNNEPTLMDLTCGMYIATQKQCTSVGSRVVSQVTRIIDSTSNFSGANTTWKSKY